MLKIEDIIEIRQAKVYDRGYEIVFPGDKIIWLTKRRTIAGLLLLLKYQTCSEEDLVGANSRLQEIKKFSRGNTILPRSRIDMETLINLLVNCGQKKAFPVYTQRDYKGIDSMF